jgi:predicted lipoprotein with Yx(FWY)xxD motif
MLAGCGGGGGIPAPVVPPRAALTLNVGRSARHPAILIDEHGTTLYVSQREHRDPSSCNAQCLSVWPLVLLQPGVTPSASNQQIGSGLVGSTTVPQGRAVTYNGYVLHTFVGDESPGDTSGQGVDGWSTIDPSGKPTG